MPAAQILFVLWHHRCTNGLSLYAMINMVVRPDRDTHKAHQRQKLCNLSSLLKQITIARAVGMQLQLIYIVKQQAIAWPLIKYL